MTSILTGHGLLLEAFDRSLAECLGAEPGEEGCLVLVEAAMLGRARVECRDWLYCLARRSGTAVRTWLVDRLGQSPDLFIREVDGGFRDGVRGFPPVRLTSDAVSESVLTMLGRSAERAHARGASRISEADLLLSLVEAAGPELESFLRVWAEDARYEKFLRELSAGRGPSRSIIVFGDHGRLQATAFTNRGWWLVGRMLEDAASLCAPRVTTRHVLYTLLSSAQSPLAAVLSSFGISPGRELHAELVRELRRTGRRQPAAVPSREAFFGSVLAVLESARKLAEARGDPSIAERDVHAAFLEAHWNELARLLSRGTHVVDRGRVLESLQAFESGEDAAGANVPSLSVPEIDASLRARILGQELAIARTVPWIKRLRSGIPRDDRPAGVFLFVGPTGTGKTQLAKELARYVFGDENRLLFIEMSHFQTRESVSGLIGAPPGYVGYGEGLLTNGLRDEPERVILFDEIEKADPYAVDIVLRFTDEGLLSDPAGPVRDGRKSLIVITSNAGQRALRQRLSLEQLVHADLVELARATLKEAEDELFHLRFRPEFLGRIDEFIPFLPFSPGVWRRLVDQTVDRETAKIFAHRAVTVDVDDAVRQALAEESFRRSLSEGARAIPRLVNERIFIPAIDRLPEQTSREGPIGQRLVVRSVGGELEWRTA